MRKIFLTFSAVLLSLGLALPGFAGTVNIYSARHYESDNALYEQFSKETGIAVNVVSGNAPELIERIRREGEATQADLFITVDGGVLYTAKAGGILQPVTSGAVLDNVPADRRDRENYWVGLTTRARVIVYSKDRVKPGDLSTYEDLASPKWKGRVVARPASSLYDQSLIASFITLNGIDAARRWVKGYADNFARPPKGNDRSQAADIAAGLADVALMNTYYLGQMFASKNPEEVRAVNAVGVFFPNQSTTGTHVNISGAGLTKFAKNPENALKFLAFITSVPAQEQLSAGNYEYPVNPKAKMHPLLSGWGAFKAQDIDFSDLGRNNAKAIQLTVEGGWK
jgi:iron(III) transport system substrate-binding protein